MNVTTRKRTRTIQFSQVALQEIERARSQLTSDPSQRLLSLRGYPELESLAADAAYEASESLKRCLNLPLGEDTHGYRAELVWVHNQAKSAISSAHETVVIVPLCHFTDLADSEAFMMGSINSKSGNASKPTPAEISDVVVFDNAAHVSAFSVDWAGSPGAISALLLVVTVDPVEGNEEGANDE